MKPSRTWVSKSESDKAGLLTPLPHTTERGSALGDSVELPGRGRAVYPIHPGIYSRSFFVQYPRCRATVLCNSTSLVHLSSMIPTPKFGRNEPCLCGSGRKFKACCLGKATTSPPTRRFPGPYLAIGVAGVVLAVVVSRTSFWPASSDRSEMAPKNSSAPMSTPLSLPLAGGTGVRPSGLMSQPSGPAPEGKIWSPEHGHWHELSAPAAQAINGGGNFTSTSTELASLTPQPPGPVPEGKVWSPEHGHWHDDVPPPPAPAPAAPAPTTVPPPPVQGE